MEKAKTVFLFFTIIIAVGSLVFSSYLYSEIQILKTGEIADENTIYSRMNSLVNNKVIPTPIDEPAVEKAVQTFSFNDCVDCEEKFNTIVSDAIAALPTSAPSSSQAVVATTNPKTTQTTYLPLGSTASSTSTDWYTIDDSSSYIDINNDFSGDPYVTFEASLKVKHGNGHAFARLWDDTNKVAVNGSEISTQNNEDYQLVKSGQLYLWNGNNNYKIQLKSLNGFEVTYTNSKIKIVY